MAEQLFDHEDRDGQKGDHWDGEPNDVGHRRIHVTVVYRKCVRRDGEDERHLSRERRTLDMGTIKHKENSRSAQASEMNPWNPSKSQYLNYIRKGAMTHTQSSVNLPGRWKMGNDAQAKLEELDSVMTWTMTQKQSSMDLTAWWKEQWRTGKAPWTHQYNKGRDDAHAKLHYQLEEGNDDASAKFYLTSNTLQAEREWLSISNACWTYQRGKRSVDSSAKFHQLTNRSKSQWTYWNQEWGDEASAKLVKLNISISTGVSNHQQNLPNLPIWRQE